MGEPAFGDAGAISLDGVLFGHAARLYQCAREARYDIRWAWHGKTMGHIFGKQSDGFVGFR